MLQVQQLGKGSHGEVCLARDMESDVLVAVKFIPRGPAMVCHCSLLSSLALNLTAVSWALILVLKMGWSVQRKDYVLREIRNHQMLCHPHIIDFKEVNVCDSYSIFDRTVCSGRGRSLPCW